MARVLRPRAGGECEKTVNHVDCEVVELQSVELQCTVEVIPIWTIAITINRGLRGCALAFADGKM